MGTLTFKLDNNFELLMRFETQFKSSEKRIEKSMWGHFDYQLQEIGDVYKKKIFHTTTLIDLLEFSNMKERVIMEIQQRLDIAPNRLELLQTFIEDTYHYYEGHYSETLNAEMFAYSCIKKGYYNANIENFANYLIQYNEVENKYTFKGFLASYDLDKIATGAAIAYLIPKLEKQLEGLKEKNVEPKITDNRNKTKLKWLGTPAQFGYIIQELVGKGYIQKPTGSYAKDAARYLELFDIETTPATLAKEISTGENQNSLSSENRAKIKIPNKDQLK